MVRPASLVAAAVVVLAGCAGHHGASASADSTGAAPAAPRGPRADRSTITEDELRQFGQPFNNLLDYINSRHNDWLRNPIGNATFAGYNIQIYYDGTRFGTDPTALRQIPIRNVALAKRLSPSEAEGRYGTNNNAGAIEVWSSLDRVR